MVGTLPATFHWFDTNVLLPPADDAEAGAYSRMNAAQRDLFARRSSHIDTARLRSMADMPSAREFTRQPDQLERGVSRIRASSTLLWRGLAGG
jgi:hypothetical protein